MAVHIIPETEPELHIKDENCKCSPLFRLDEESGEIVWLHNILDFERIIDGLIDL